jgi:lysophospholipase L1-like esterase
MKSFCLKLLLLFPLLFLSACGGDDDGNDNSGPRTIITLGDSITADTNYPGTPPWPELVQSQRPEWTIINRARGNERVASVRRKAAAISESPDVVVIMVGSVNAIHFDLGSYQADLTAAIQSAQATGAKVLVCTIPPMLGPRIGWASTVNRVNGMVRSAASATGATLVDVYSELQGQTERFPDGLHPDLDGQRIIAVAIREKV